MNDWYFIENVQIQTCVMLIYDKRWHPVELYTVNIRREGNRPAQGESRSRVVAEDGCPTNMAADLYRVGLPSPWNYAATSDGRVFFIK